VVTTGGSQPLANAYTYTGRERDASGLDYYRARYYLPSAGRFLTPDPIGLQGGLNAYGYVGSNPVNFTDPFGLRAGAPLGPAGPRVPVLAAASAEPSNAGASPGVGIDWSERFEAKRGALDEQYPTFRPGQSNAALETIGTVIDLDLGTIVAFGGAPHELIRASHSAALLNVMHGGYLAGEASAAGDPFATTAYTLELGLGVWGLVHPAGLVAGAAFFATDVGYPGGVGGLFRDFTTGIATNAELYEEYPQAHPYLPF
jgi:RHS repeat-associated protein